MTAGVQCDTCRSVRPPSTPPGWLYLVRTPSGLSSAGDPVGARHRRPDG